MSQVKLKLVQITPSLDISANTDIVIENLQADTISIFPEGFLSGYSTSLDKEFLDQLDPEVLKLGLNRIARKCQDLHACAIIGSLFYVGGWRNSGFLITAKGDIHRYDKVNLATHERGVLMPGKKLPTWSIEVDQEQIALAIQLCRELKYPEQWRVLSLKGVELIIHLNNAVGDSSEQLIWRSQLIARATENQRFVASVNVASDEQKSPSMVISPFGEIEFESQSSQQVQVVEIDTKEVSNWYLNQRTCDVVDITHNKS